MSKHSGCYGLTEVESKTMMALWCIWATPLLMSNDLTNITAVDKAILQNKKVIAGTWLRGTEVYLRPPVLVGIRAAAKIAAVRARHIANTQIQRRTQHVHFSEWVPLGAV